MASGALQITNITTNSISVALTTYSGSSSLYNFGFFINGMSDYVSSSVPTYTFTGLSCGTSYTSIAGRYTLKTGGTTTVDTNTATTSSCPVYPSVPTISTNSISSNSVSIQITRGANTSFVAVSITGPGYSDLHNSYADEIWTFTGLSPNTSYTVTCFARNLNGDTSGNTLYLTTPAAVPVPSLPSVSTSTTQSTVTATVTFGINTTYVNVIICPDGSTTQVSGTPVLVVNTSGGSVTFTGLTSGTAYDIRYRAYYNESSFTSQEKVDVTTTSFGTFSWDVSLSAGASATVYASKWNDLQSKINIKRVAKNLGNYPFTVAGIGNSIMANMANQLILSMSTMGSGLPGSVSSGDVISGAWLSQIASSYNNIT